MEPEQKFMKWIDGPESPEGGKSLSSDELSTINYNCWHLKRMVEVNFKALRVPEPPSYRFHAALALRNLSQKSNQKVVD